MFRALTQLSALCAASLAQNAQSELLPVIFGTQGSVSPVPSNTAKYLLDLEQQEVYLHYYGDDQIFLLALSPKLKEHLENVDSSNDNPVTYDVDHLAGGISDWSRVPGWTGPEHGADAEKVFYGREIRDAPTTKFGNVIHLSLGPEEDEEGWTPAETDENYKFWHAIHNGASVGAADGLRQFRSNIGSQLGGSFEQRWGTGVTTKAHRFVLQMYTAQSQKNSPGHFFEMFPNEHPPTADVVFFEAEDGCKGTPTPIAEGFRNSRTLQGRLPEAQGGSGSASLLSFLSPRSALPQ